MAGSNGGITRKINCCSCFALQKRKLPQEQFRAGLSMVLPKSNMCTSDNVNEVVTRVATRSHKTHKEREFIIKDNLKKKCSVQQPNVINCKYGPEPPDAIFLSKSLLGGFASANLRDLYIESRAQVMECFPTMGNFRTRSVCSQREFSDTTS
ncbi:hypothetical protein PUN28_005456 [Cardiocondyla obscurior]|uniref:Uncharacterized protein n=1 Tax=Cardiocondyla obscurior TaxID=286306 RepID=A0AAW2GI13_9HYME